MLGQLKPKSAQMLIPRYGLNDGRPRPLAEVSELIGISRERVRRLELKALQRL